ncbi:MAG: ABC transporter substrate-binding protein [Alphaproteobacteria bacterium]
MQRTTALCVAAAAMAIAPGAATAQEVIELWHPFTLETDMIYPGVEQFNASQSEYVVEARIVPGPDIATELVKAIATGSVPDLVTIDNPLVPSFSAEGTLEDLTDLIAASDAIDPAVFFPGPMNSVTWDGRYYGVPRDANTLALYYNVDMFRAAGLDPDNPPATWDELKQAARALNDPDHNVYGLAYSAYNSEEGPFQWLPFLYQNGGSITDLASPEAVEALEFWKSFIDEGLTSPDVINMRQYEATNTWKAQNAAMVVGGPWELPKIDQEAQFEWRVALLPVRGDGKDIHASSLGGFDYVIPAGADHVEGAFQFIEFMSVPKFLDIAWPSGRLAPMTTITVADPQWPQAYAVFREQLASARARGPHPRWPEISRPLAIALQEALTGTKTAAEALQGAQDAIAPILAEQPLPDTVQ